MKRILCILSALVILLGCCGCDKSEKLETLENSFSSFESEIRLISKDVNSLFVEMFTTSPELQVYLGEISVTTEGFEMVISAEYENTSLDRESITVGVPEEAFPKAIRSTLAECKGQGAAVLLNHAEQPDPEIYLDALRKEDYLNIMGMESSQWVFTDNQFTDDMIVYYTFNYIDSAERILEYREAVRQEIARLSQQLWSETDDKEQRVRAIHDYLANNARYNTTETEDLLRDHTPYGVLMDGVGVCDSYTYAAHLLLNEAGIENYIVEGQSENTEHTWNIVKIGENYYHLDITWDDPVSSSGKEYVLYDYYLKSDETMKEDHIWEGELPKCEKDY